MLRRGLTLAALVALSTGGCGGDESGSGRITLLASGTPSELSAQREVIRAFRTREPGIGVRLIEARDPDDVLRRFSVSPTDLVLLDSRAYARLGDDLDAVHGRLEDSNAFDEGDFYSQALDAFRRGDEVICAPRSVSTLVVYYNRELFRKARISEPAAGWTWNDMVAAAGKLTRDLDGDGEPDQHGLGLGAEPLVTLLAPFVWSNGGELLSNDENPAQFMLQSPRALDALRDFLDLGAKRHVIPAERERKADSDEARFAAGRLGMLLSSRLSTSRFREQPKLNWDVAPLPIRTEPRVGLEAEGYCLADASDDKGVAWRFIEFAVGSEGQRIAARSGGVIPSLRALAESEAFLDPSTRPANARAFLALIPLARRLPGISTWPEIEAVAERHLRSGLYQDVPAPVVARRLTEETRALFAQGE